MKIKFIKEYVAVDPVPTSGIIHRYRVGEAKEITPYTAQWLIDNGFAEEVKESGQWKPKFGEMYFFLNSTGKIKVEPWLSDKSDEYRYSMGECFKTEKAAEAWRDYRTAIATVRQDEGVLTPEQATKNGYVYYIRPHAVSGLGVHGFNADYVSVNTVLFDTREHAKASLDKHPDEWEAIANYDWSRE